MIEEVLKPNPAYRKADDIYSYYEGCVKLFGEEIRKDREKHKGLLIYATQRFKELTNLSQNTDYAFADLFYQVLQFPLFKDLIELMYSLILVFRIYDLLIIWQSSVSY